MTFPSGSTMPGVRRLAASAAGLAVCCALLAGCGQASGANAQSITLYSGQHVQTTQALVAAFKKQTGITVNVRSDDEDQLADKAFRPRGYKRWFNEAKTKKGYSGVAIYAKQQPDGQVELKIYDEAGKLTIPKPMAPSR